MIAALPPFVKFGGPPFAGGLLAVSVAVDNTELALAVISAVNALVLGLLGYRQARNDRRADTEERRGNRHDRLIDQLQEQLNVARAAEVESRTLIRTLERDLRDQSRRLTEIELGAVRLVDQIERLDIDPVWRPPPPPTKPT